MDQRCRAVRIEAVIGYAEENNRLNREGHASGATDRRELAGLEQKTAITEWA
ncbi:MAG: hypothetical protein OXI95_09345 [bacterium]|nr:hypothetical protein [bacterium]